MLSLILCICIFFSFLLFFMFKKHNFWTFWFWWFFGLKSSSLFLKLSTLFSRLKESHSCWNSWTCVFYFFYGWLFLFCHFYKIVHFRLASGIFGASDFEFFSFIYIFSFLKWCYQRSYVYWGFNFCVCFSLYFVSRICTDR